ncbi:MAG: DEAD/DEAH box helicase [Dehalococcoidia bacterium]
MQTAGYTAPTPIQRQAIPSLLSGRDLLGCAQTGTGKTAAFALPILQKLAAAPANYGPRAPRALVLAPTRELAGQVRDSFRTYGRNLKLTAFAVFGGVPIERQIRELERGVDILVATPGRLIDLINQRKARLDRVEVVVLDEADRMLDMGFIKDVNRIVGLTANRQQTLLFSATMPQEIAKLAEALLTNPERVSVTPPATVVASVEESVVFVEHAEKRAYLSSFLRQSGVERALIFTRTKHGANRVVQHLCDDRIEAGALHGNKSQAARERALDDFKTGRTKVLVATDLAARGIDVTAISHVVNFDLPDDPDSYVHRIGRTARAGATGIAVTFCASNERMTLRTIEKRIGHKISAGDTSRYRPAARGQATPTARDAAPTAPREAAPQPQPSASRGDARRNGPPHSAGPRPSRQNGAGPRHNAPSRPAQRRSGGRRSAASARA